MKSGADTDRFSKNQNLAFSMTTGRSTLEVENSSFNITHFSTKVNKVFAEKLASELKNKNPTPENITNFKDEVIRELAKQGLYSIDVQHYLDAKINLKATDRDDVVVKQVMLDSFVSNDNKVLLLPTMQECTKEAVQKLDQNSSIDDIKTAVNNIHASYFVTKHYLDLFEKEPKQLDHVLSFVESIASNVEERNISGIASYMFGVKVDEPAPSPQEPQNQTYFGMGWSMLKSGVSSAANILASQAPSVVQTASVIGSAVSAVGVKNIAAFVKDYATPGGLFSVRETNVPIGNKTLLKGMMNAVVANPRFYEVLAEQSTKFINFVNINYLAIRKKIELSVPDNIKTIYPAVVDDLTSMVLNTIHAYSKLPNNEQANADFQQKFASISSFVSQLDKVYEIKNSAAVISTLSNEITEINKLNAIVETRKTKYISKGLSAKEAEQKSNKFIKKYIGLQIAEAEKSGDQDKAAMYKKFQGNVDDKFTKLLTEHEKTLNDKFEVLNQNIDFVFSHPVMDELKSQFTTIFSNAFAEIVARPTGTAEQKSQQYQETKEALGHFIDTLAKSKVLSADNVKNIVGAYQAYTMAQFMPESNMKYQMYFDAFSTLMQSMPEAITSISKDKSNVTLLKTFVKNNNFIISNALINSVGISKPEEQQIVRNFVANVSGKLVEQPEQYQKFIDGIGQVLESKSLEEMTKNLDTTLKTIANTDLSSELAKDENKEAVKILMKNVLSQNAAVKNAGLDPKQLSIVIGELLPTIADGNNLALDKLAKVMSHFKAHNKDADTPILMHIADSLGKESKTGDKVIHKNGIIIPPLDTKLVHDALDFVGTLSSNIASEVKDNEVLRDAMVSLVEHNDSFKTLSKATGISAEQVIDNGVDILTNPEFKEFLNFLTKDLNIDANTVKMMLDGDSNSRLPYELSMNTAVKLFDYLAQSEENCKKAKRIFNGVTNNPQTQKFIENMVYRVGIARSLHVNPIKDIQVIFDKNHAKVLSDALKIYIKNEKLSFDAIPGIVKGMVKNTELLKSVLEPVLSLVAYKAAVENLSPENKRMKFQDDIGDDINRVIRNSDKGKDPKTIHLLQELVNTHNKEDKSIAKDDKAVLRKWIYQEGNFNSLDIFVRMDMDKLEGKTLVLSNLDLKDCGFITIPELPKGAKIKFEQVNLTGNEVVFASKDMANIEFKDCICNVKVLNKMLEKNPDFKSKLQITPIEGKENEFKVNFNTKKSGGSKAKPKQQSYEADINSSKTPTATPKISKSTGKQKG